MSTVGVFENLIIITSIINVSSKPLDLFQSRSVYTAQERFDQTLETIESIRRRIPFACIVLIESSSINDVMEATFKERVDVYANISEIQFVQYAANEHLNKSLGEIIQLQYFFINHYDKLQEMFDFRRLYKISGRYFLNDYFDYDFTKNPFDMFVRLPDQHMISALYKIDDLVKYRKKLDEIYKRVAEDNDSMEKALGSLYFRETFITCTRLGGMGCIAVAKDAVVEF